MSRRDLRPEDVEAALKKGKGEPFYLFHGPNEFMIERLLEKVKDALLPESARPFNLEIFYGGEKEADPAEILTRAKSVPFLAERRLIVVRRTEQFRQDLLERFLPYLQRPCETTCLVLISAKADFKKAFYQAIRSEGRSVQFEELKEDRLSSWIRKTAEELGFRIHPQACLYLQQVVGNNQRELFGEMEKLKARFGDGEVGLQEVREMAVHSRSFTIFELMNRISARNGPASLGALNRFLEEEDKKGGPLRLLGMLNRQMRLLWTTRAILDKRGKKAEVAEKLGPARFSADEFISSARNWTVAELESALGLLYQADGWIKGGSPAGLVLENLVLGLCVGRELR